MATLFDPLVVGELILPNRIVMAPLTRCRAPGAGNLPNAMMAEYDSQRASAGLIITEGVPVDPMGVGFADLPGIWTAEQVAGWRAITDAVRNDGGRIFMRLWHVGRLSDPIFLHGRLPIAPSPIPPIGTVTMVRPKQPWVVPRAATSDDIHAVIAAFRRGAENAQQAGFDGVEIHGANGYLLDQFLEDGSNHRTDAFGGSTENRARLLLEVTDAVVSVWGAGRVGVHLSPRADGHSMGDSNPRELFGYVAGALGRRSIAFLLGREAQREDSLGPTLKKRFGGVYIANERFTLECAKAITAAGDADAVAFGKAFLANPDLPRRFASHAPLNEQIPTTFYSAGPTGYIDYPALPAAP